MTNFDSLDLHIAFAVCADTFGLDGAGADAITREGPGSTYRFSSGACDALAAAASDFPPSDGWVEIVCVPLVEELCDLVGAAWRGEASVAAEQVVSERVDALADMANAGRLGPVTFDLTSEAASLVESRVITADMAALV